MCKYFGVIDIIMVCGDMRATSETRLTHIRKIWMWLSMPLSCATVSEVLLAILLEGLKDLLHIAFPAYLDTLIS